MNQSELDQYNSALANYGLTVDEFIKIRKSTEFFKLDAEMKSVSPRYMEIPPAIRETALVAILAGKTKNISSIFDSYYYRPIISFEEFISPKYLPKMSKSLFNTWKEGLTKVFDPNKAYYEIVYSGAIGTGKSTSAMVAHAYNLSRITSLANPQQAMGVAHTTQMTLLLMSILKGKAVQVLLDPLITILDDCPLFFHVEKYKHLMEVHNDTKGKVTPFYVGKETIYFPNNIFVQIGSEMRHAIGAGLFGASLDEAEFRRGASSESVYKLYYQMKERVRSRFIGLRYILLTLISSVQSETGMITQYIKTLPEGSPHTVVFDYPIWEVRFPNAIKEDGYFYVMRGNVAHPSRVLTGVESEAMDQGAFVVPNGCKVIKVPKRYEQEFITNVSVALMNLAGMASAGDEKPFSDVEAIVDPKLSQELTIEINLEGPNEEPLDIGKILIEAGVFRKFGEYYQTARCPDSLKYCHLDMADSGIAGISMCHKELGVNNKVLYVFDFILRITTKTSISFESVRRFYHDLKNKFNCNIHTLTSDQYQSTALRQNWATNKIAKEIHHLSVDRTAEQYWQFAAAVTAGQVKAGKCPYLQEQLNIIRISNGKPYAENGVRKDVADSCCGSLYNAICNGSDIPIHLYDEITDEQVYEAISSNLLSKYKIIK